MPDAEFGFRPRQFGFVIASAVSVVAVVAVVALVVNPWRDTAAGSTAAGAPGSVFSSDSPLASPMNTSSAVSVSEPALFAAPASSPAVSSGAPVPATATPQVSRRPLPTTPGVVEDSAPNFKVSVQVSPTQVVWGHPVRVTVTVVNAGGRFDRPVEMFVQGSDPSDNVSDPPPTCTADGALVCPITGVRPGRKWSFTFTFIPGPFPGTDGFDDPVAAAFNYTDSHGQQQESPLHYAHVLLFDPPASPPPASGAPSNTPSPPAPPASPTSPASTSATSAPQSAG